jgi:hypothetical protein
MAGAAGSTAGTGGGAAGTGGGAAGTGGGAAGTGGGAAGTGGGAAGTGGGAAGAGGGPALPTCTSTMATSTPMSAADFCTLLLDGCSGVSGFTLPAAYANMGMCVSNYGMLTATGTGATQQCRSYHLCNALGAGPKTTHCPHAVGMMGQCM